MTQRPMCALLGASELRVSRVVLGGMCIRQTTGVSGARQLLDRARDLGVTTIDTAPLYDFGQSERLIGELLPNCGGAIDVLTKVGLRWDSDHGDVLFEANDATYGRVTVRRDSRPQSVRLEVERSSKRLGLDCLPLVQVHQFDRLVPVADTMGELSRLREEGKVREIGVSNYSSEQVAGAAAALDGGLASVQSQYNLLSRDVERRELAYARGCGIGFLAYSPLGQGLLAGRMLDGRAPPPDYRAAEPNFQPANLAQIHRFLAATLRPIAVRHGVGVGTVALAWLLARQEVSAVIVGASSPDQLQASVGALAVDLAVGELRAIDEASAALRLQQAGRGFLRRAARKAKRVGLSLLGR